MVPRPPPIIAPPLVFRPHWETLVRLASTRSKPLDLGAGPRRVSRAELPPSVLLRNRQTEAYLVLRPKPRNHCGDFEAQITKPELQVLRPKQGNPPTPWFCGSTKKPATSFEAKPGETVTTSFEVKLEKIVATGFEAKPEKTITTGFEAKPPETVTAGFKAKPLQTVATGFEAKPAKTVQVVLRPNHSQTITIGFEAQTDEKLSQWF
jgi:hypothetical protein